MPIPYSFLRVIQGKKAFILDRENRNPKQQAEFLMRDGNMHEKYLGACLDSSRWGSQIDVMYEMTINGMIGFIQSWMSQNPNNFQGLYHEEAIENLYTRFELPYIDHKVCPRNNKHQGIITDLSGKIRCAYTDERRFKPTFVSEDSSYKDKLSGLTRLTILETHPMNYGYDEDDPKLKPLLDKWNNEPTVVYRDSCYAILSDIDLVLPLETILRRLNTNPETKRFYCSRRECTREEKKESYLTYNTCRGHEGPNNEITFPFDGWDLAFYVKKWREQVPNGQAPLFERR